MALVAHLSGNEWTECLSTPEENLSDLFMCNPRIKDGVYAYWGIPAELTWAEAMEILCDDYKQGGKTRTIVGSVDLSVDSNDDKRHRTPTKHKESPRRLSHGRYSALAKDVLRKAHVGKSTA